MNPLVEKPLLICGFPKSGNTWIGYMLSYYFNAHYYDAHAEEGIRSGGGASDEEEDKLMYNKDGFLGQHLRDDQPKPFTCIIKSHVHPRNFLSKHPLFFAEVPASPQLPILIVREPKDVAVSYFFFTYFHLRLMQSGSILNRLPAGLRVILKKALYFDKFVLGVADQWRDYHQEWLQTPHHLIRYEDLKTDTYGAMHGLMEKLGVPIQEKYLREAIEYCRFENLKKIELNYVKPKSKHDSFFREGKSGGWVKHFPRVLTRKFHENLGSIYTTLGYHDPSK